MSERLRLLVLTVFRVASVGIAAGALRAAEEVVARRYLAQHLWHTTLWTLADATRLGAMGGAAAGLFLCASLAGWQARRTRDRSLDSSREEARSRFAVGLVTCYAVCAACVLLLVPVRAPEVLGLSHWVFAGAGLAVVWLAAAASASGFVPVWPLAVASAYLVGLAQLWARAWPDWITAAVASAGFLVALGLGTVRPHRPGWARRPAPSFLRAAARRAPVVAIAGAAVLWTAAGVVGLQAHLRIQRACKNVLIIAVDTLRYDAVSLLSPHEHAVDLTPELRKRLASRATIFTHAYSQAPWTLPAFSSIFTGLYPEQHGAEYVWSKLGPEQLTLAELLREQGYATQAVISGHYLTKEIGTTQGFSGYDEAPLNGKPDAIAAGVTDGALRFLRADHGKRFFLFAHYFDPHVPYLPHRETEEVVQRARRAGGAGIDQIAQNRFLYEGEIAYADRQIGRLLKFLDEHDLWRSTCVIFVADHGEEFLDHGGLQHDDTLFQELIHVPLAIAAPGLPLPHVVADPVETRWLFRAVLDLAGVPLPARASALPSLLAPGTGENRYARSATCLHGRHGAKGSAAEIVWLSSLEGGRYKLIADHVKHRRLLFDLRADSPERHDLSRQLPAVCARMTRALAAQDAELLREEKHTPVRRLGAEERRQLKSLGYL